MKKIMLNTIIDGNEKQNVLDYETEIKPKFVPNAGDRLQIKSGCLLFFTVINRYWDEDEPEIIRVLCEMDEAPDDGDSCSDEKYTYEQLEEMFKEDPRWKPRWNL